MSKLIYEEESFFIRGAVFEVYRQLGSGFLENVYQECLAHELSLQNIPFHAQKKLSIFYKGREIHSHYIADFICFDKVIVELKALENITDAHQAQVMNYLKATDFKLGLLVNFGDKAKATVKRIVL